MDRRVMGGVGMVAALAVIVGCSSDNAVSEKNEFGPMQEKVAKISANGGLAAVGVGESRSISAALDKAKTRARTEMGFVIETKLSALRKDFSEEVGEGKGSEINTLFSTVAKHLTDNVLRGTVATDVKYETKDGVTTAYALVEQNPKIFAQAMENVGPDANKAMYTRFRSSQAFKELDEEVKKYEEFKKQQGGM
jgi:hypothetical protein